MDDGAADFGFSIAGRVAVALFIILLLLVAYFIAWETVSRSVRLSHVERSHDALADELHRTRLELEDARKVLAVQTARPATLGPAADPSIAPQKTTLGSGRFG